MIEAGPGVRFAYGGEHAGVGTAREPLSAWLRVRRGQLIRHLAVGTSVDEAIGAEFTAVAGRPPVGGTYRGRADVTVLWFRGDVGADLGALLERVAAVTRELIWLFTPAAPVAGFVGEPHLLAAARRAELFAELDVLRRGPWIGARLHLG